MLYGEKAGASRHGGKALKITGVQDLHALAGWRPLAFVKMTTDEGLVGWSEYNDTYGAPGSMTALIHKFADLVTGMDPRDVGRITSSLQALTRIVAGGPNQQAIAALENACLDIKAKALGVPVYALFGGAIRKRLQLYWSHCGSLRARHADLFEQWGRFRVESLDDIKRLGQDAVARGFKAIKTNPLFLENGKLRMGHSIFRIGPHLLERNINNVYLRSIRDQLAAFRDGLGPDAGLMIDINFNQRTEGYIRIARAVEPYDLTWLELDIHDPQALAVIRRASPAPIASLESIHGMRGYRAYFENSAVDVAIVDVLWNGLWESFRIATLADAYEVNVAPHNYSGHLASLISAHLCAVIPNFRIMEYEADDVPWMGEFFTHPCVVENGELVLPDRPGWGTDVNEEAVRAHPVAGRA
jgi:galactonate dehydratase